MCYQRTNRNVSGVELDEACSCDNECLNDNSVCDRGTGVCVCVDTHFALDGTCEPRKFISIIKRAVYIRFLSQQQSIQKT